jgi:hypothetical protein
MFDVSISEWQFSRKKARASPVIDPVIPAKTYRND